jgi:coenzyme F420-0:L-glutamate ligase/coenzyme F420-1:gamma-L-glutamate ligase
VTLHAYPVHGVPEVRPGDDLASLLVAGLTSDGGPGLQDGDVLVVTSKVVSKAEGRLVVAQDRDEVIDSETATVVSQWNGPNGRTVIARTRHGLVLAAAGVDASNTDHGTLVLLPENPDGSARRLRTALRDSLCVSVGVVVSDTMGRAWRVGQTDAAIGAAGLRVLDDLRGGVDSHGRRLDATFRAVADEIACVADLVAGKASGIPAVVVRGVENMVLNADDPGPGASAMIRPEAEDRFRLGTVEAMRAAVLQRRTVRSFSDGLVPADAIERAIEAAKRAPAPHHTQPWEFVVLHPGETRTRLLDGMRAAWIADLEADGLGDESITRILRRGDLLRSAPVLVVPLLRTDGAHDYPDERRSSAERTMFVLSMGAAIENMLIHLAAEGLGACWTGSTLFCPDRVRATLGLSASVAPQGCLAIGWPAEV